MNKFSVLVAKSYESSSLRKSRICYSKLHVGLQISRWKVWYNQSLLPTEALLNRRDSQQPESHTACPLSTCLLYSLPTSAPCSWLSQAGTPRVPRFLSSRLHADTQTEDFGNQQKQIGWGGAPRRRRLPPSSLTGSFSDQLHNSISLGQLFLGRACRALTTCKQSFSARCSRGSSRHSSRSAEAIWSSYLWPTLPPRISKDLQQKRYPRGAGTAILTSFLFFQGVHAGKVAR